MALQVILLHVTGNGNIIKHLTDNMSQAGHKDSKIADYKGVVSNEKINSIYDTICI